MAYYPDLSLYTYYSPLGESLTTLNVGWLDRVHVYPQGEMSDVFTERLWSFCHKPVLKTRGVYGCDFCPKANRFDIQRRGDEELLLGTAQLRVFGQGDTVYAAPDLIYHYVVAHRYCPPAEFIQAVLTGPLPGSSEYQERARAHDWWDEAQRWWKILEEQR
ncbi:MAG: hypothetical protein CVU38_20995 [Chloroflexi bacterium HGW-Chloroflexi-1]|nr:MAG: hypothetical protein CVU38_20995 [Chloroflexi bacterium HGW-Chloroflexi-1]